MIWHAVERIGRIPSEFYTDRAHAGDHGDGIFNFDGQGLGNRTRGRGKCHQNSHVAGFGDIHIVNQAQVVDIDGEFGIENHLQGFDDFAF